MRTLTCELLHTQCLILCYSVSRGGVAKGMDAQIGRVLEALDANGLTENTIVIFTSDNGGERFADTWPFIGKKTELLEGGLRILCVPKTLSELMP